ncbi:MAG: sodium-dependent transporter [candidate division KSB1 bacterium]|nr:sodium-dependent transporter [candidate division KSB1 bacterium]
MDQDNAKRGAWGSRIAFVFAAAGSAIGLGNIWRFPYVTGENGGAAFVLLYIGFVVLIGLPVMIAELSLGRATQLNPVGAFRKIVPKGLWKGVGMLGVLTGIGILSYYSVIAGWTVGYFFKTSGRHFAKALSSEESVELFTQFVGDPALNLALLLVFVTLTSMVVMGGISGGIERWVKILMPITAHSVDFTHPSLCHSARRR